jgi:tripeptidyl-peptidase-1
MRSSTLLCLTAVAVAALLPAAAAAQARIATDVNATPFLPFELVVGLPHRSPAELERAFWRISTPADPEYLQHLTLESAAALVGSDEATLAAASRWLLACGADSVTTSRLRDTVTGRFQSPPLGWAGGKVCPHGHGTRSPSFEFLLRRDPSSSSAPARWRGGKAGFGGGYSVPAQKKAYGIPSDLAATNATGLQMVWGPGTFGFSMSALEQLKRTQVPLLNTSRVTFDTPNHGEAGGDNFGEGQLDTEMISSFGLNVNTLVSNTNTSASTEEGKGFGLALLDFATQLASRERLPQVLSISLGSLGAYACDLLCDKAVARGVSKADCDAFLQEQRQVCMFLSQAQVARINAAFQVLGARGVTVFGSSGDGGSHFSFGPFANPGGGAGSIASVLNEISCDFQMPVFPTTSPYITSVGGTSWAGIFNPNPAKPVAWTGSGGGFSWEFPAPPHQGKTVSSYLDSHKRDQGFPVPGVAFNASGRAYPDISAVAVEGTSQSSPTMAGIFSLLMDMRLNAGLPPLGFIGPRLWKVGEAFPGEAFQSVDSGNTKTSCSTGFPASKASWDPVTGWGRPVWSGIVKHFGSDNN